MREWGYTGEKITDIDSEILLHLYRYRRDGNEFEMGDDSLKWVSSKIAGGKAYAMVDLKNPRYLFLLKDFKPLTIAYDSRLGVFLFNSEKKNIVNSFGGGVNPSCNNVFPMRKSFVPHSGHVPWTAACPFFVKTASGLLTVRFTLHFTQ